MALRMEAKPPVLCEPRITMILCATVLCAPAPSGPGLLAGRAGLAPRAPGLLAGRARSCGGLAADAVVAGVDRRGEGEEPRLGGLAAGCRIGGCPAGRGLGAGCATALLLPALSCVLGLGALPPRVNAAAGAPTGARTVRPFAVVLAGPIGPPGGRLGRGLDAGAGRVPAGGGRTPPGHVGVDVPAPGLRAVEDLEGPIEPRPRDVGLVPAEVRAPTGDRCGIALRPAGAEAEDAPLSPIEAGAEARLRLPT